MLPSTAPLFDSAGRCFYVLEGVPKTDAIRSVNEPSCGVPAVSHWRAVELDAVIARYFKGKLVVVVVDSDLVEMAGEDAGDSMPQLPSAPGAWTQ